MYPTNLAESQLKTKVMDDFFNLKSLEASVEVVGSKVDFRIFHKENNLFGVNFLWAEAKKGNDKDIIASLVQLILTIGKERTFENERTPIFIGAFDCEKIAFVYYDTIAHIFIQTDFNWNVRPSDHNTKEFKQLYGEIKELLESKKLQFRFKEDREILKDFIAQNFTPTNERIGKIEVGAENFIHTYYRWLDEVAPSIQINWEMESPDILSADFFLADLLSENNNTESIKKNLRILLRDNLYKVNFFKQKGKAFFAEFQFLDNQKAHTAFWNLYERPPKEEFWDFFIQRRDLLMPSDIRERKGEFFTPRIWVEKAHTYLAHALGKAFYDDYIIWDCAAGTGNLLRGLNIDKYNIYASTLRDEDVRAMQDMYGKEGGSLANGHIFQFNFLNDVFFDKPCEIHKNQGADIYCSSCVKSKLPESLQKILSDEEKRKKLVIFINPPYAEATSATQVTGTGKNKDGVSLGNATYEKYKDSMGKASNELFAQFFFRIYKEIPDCILASFSTLKYVNASNFVNFRETFEAKFLKGFIVPAFTFDNVKGQFPIGFLIWDLSKKINFRVVEVDVFDHRNMPLGTKKFHAPAQGKSKNKRVSINHWIKEFNEIGPKMALLDTRGSDFQNQQYINIRCAEFIITAHSTGIYFTLNLAPVAIYFSVRHCIKATWLNDRDQFLYPKDSWRSDSEFHSDCLAFMLFHGQNKITCKEGINHFIPFKESEVGAKERFESDFIVRFMQGKIKFESAEKGGFAERSLYVDCPIITKPIIWSEEAQNVLEAGRELWKHYHTQAQDSKDYLINASLYDIKAYFQGFSPKGKMNPPAKAQDEVYKNLLGALNYELSLLAQKLESKVYEHGFLEE